MRYHTHYGRSPSESYPSGRISRTAFDAIVQQAHAILATPIVEPTGPEWVIDFVCQDCGHRWEWRGKGKRFRVMRACPECRGFARAQTVPDALDGLRGLAAMAMAPED